jgi:hypothetical protein
MIAIWVLGLADAGSATDATTLHRPTINVTTPNGLEILSVNDIFEVQFETVEDQRQHISKIEVYYLRDGVAPEGECNPSEAAGEYGTDNSADVYPNSECYWSNTCTGGSQVLSNTGANNNGSAAGDATTSFLISDNTGGQEGSSDQINHNTKVLVRVYDVGDYDGGNIECHQDVSDGPFTMAAHVLSKEFDAGWHLFGPALEVYDTSNGDLTHEIDLVDHLDATGNVCGDDCNMGAWFS